MLKDKLYIIITSLIIIISVGVNIHQASRYSKAYELIECYDRVVDTIDEDYFLDVICTTDEWRDLQNCTERNHLGCGCPKDIMPINSSKQN